MVKSLIRIPLYVLDTLKNAFASYILLENFQKKKLVVFTRYSHVDIAFATWDWLLNTFKCYSFMQGMSTLIYAMIITATITYKYHLIYSLSFYIMLNNN